MVWEPFQLWQPTTNHLSCSERRRGLKFDCTKGLKQWGKWQDILCSDVKVSIVLIQRRGLYLFVCAMFFVPVTPASSDCACRSNILISSYFDRVICGLRHLSSHGRRQQGAMGCTSAPPWHEKNGLGRGRTRAPRIPYYKRSTAQNISPLSRHKSNHVSSLDRRILSTWILLKLQECYLNCSNFHAHATNLC